MPLRVLLLVTLMMPAYCVQAATMYSGTFTGVITGSQTSTETGTGAGLLSGSIMEYSLTSVLVLTANDFGIGNGSMEFTRSGEFDLVNLVGLFSATDCTVLSGSSSLCDDFGVPIIDAPFSGFAVSATSGPSIEVTFIQSGQDLIYNFSEVPIPAAAWLFGSALLGLGAIKRRKT